MHQQQLTSAKVELAKEVAAEADPGRQFTAPLSGDELAFYDPISSTSPPGSCKGEDVLAQIARDLLEVMRRDIKSDGIVRGDVRAKHRSSI